MLSLPPAPEPKLLPGEVLYVGMDLGYGESVAVEERFYADGFYEFYVNGKLMESSPYWHGKSPFVIMDKEWSTL